MKLSPDQLDALIYFLLYITALGVLATVMAGLDSFIRFIINRKVLKLKRLSVCNSNTKLDNARILR